MQGMPSLFDLLGDQKRLVADATPSSAALTFAQVSRECRDLMYARMLRRGWQRKRFYTPLDAVVGSMEQLRYARDLGCPWDARTCAAAAAVGTLDVLQYARANGCAWDARQQAPLRWVVTSRSFAGQKATTAPSRPLRVRRRRVVDIYTQCASSGKAAAPGIQSPQRGLLAEGTWSSCSGQEKLAVPGTPMLCLRPHGAGISRCWCGRRITARNFQTGSIVSLSIHTSRTSSPPIHCASMFLIAGAARMPQQHEAVPWISSTGLSCTITRGLGVLIIIKAGIAKTTSTPALRGEGTGTSLSTGSRTTA